MQGIEEKGWCELKGRLIYTIQLFAREFFDAILPAEICGKKFQLAFFSNKIFSSQLISRLLCIRHSIN